MGLLDIFNSDDGMQGLGLLAAAGPSMQPQNLASRLAMAGQTYKGLQDDALKQKLLTTDLSLKALAEQRAQQAFAMQQDAYYGSPSSGATGGAAPSAGTPSGSIPSTPGAAVGTPALGGGGGPDLDKIRRMAIAGVPGAKEALEIFKYQNEPLAMKAGDTYVNRVTGARETVPILGPGQAFVGGQVINLPGYVGAATDLSSAQEGAKADQQIVSVPDGNGGMRQMFGSAARSVLPGGNVGAAPSQWLGAEPEGRFVGDASNIRATISAIKDPMERAAASRALDNQLRGAKGALPVSSAASGGPLGYTPPASVLEAEKTRAVGAETSGQAYQNALHDKVDNEFQLVNRNKMIEPLLDKFKTGGFAAEERLHFANALQNSGTLPDSLKGRVSSWVTGGDPTAGKVIENQIASAAITTMLDTLNKEGKPNRAIFQQLQKAQEGLQSGNTTLKDVFALQKQLYDIHYNEQQALTKAIKSGEYSPATWAGDYSRIRNDGLSQPSPMLPSAGGKGASGPSITVDGKTYTFPDQKALANFKLEAGIK